MYLFACPTLGRAFANTLSRAMYARPPALGCAAPRLQERSVLLSGGGFQRDGQMLALVADIVLRLSAENTASRQGNTTFARQRRRRHCPRRIRTRHVAALERSDWSAHASGYAESRTSGCQRTSSNFNKNKTADAFNISAFISVNRRAVVVIFIITK